MKAEASASLRISGRNSLARHSDNPEIWTALSTIGGRETTAALADDAEDQAQHFSGSVAAKTQATDEAMFCRRDYVTALEHVPPTAGLWNYLLDRMVLFANNHTIRDDDVFPATIPINLKWHVMLSPSRCRGFI